LTKFLLLNFFLIIPLITGVRTIFCSKCFGYECLITIATNAINPDVTAHLILSDFFMLDNFTRYLVVFAII
jgi:hypothetical protein